MAEIINTDPKTSSDGHSRLNLPKLSNKLLMVIAVAVVVVAGVLIYTYANNTNRHNSSDKYTYRYKNLAAASVTLLSAPKGIPPPANLAALPSVNLSFQKPPELQLLANSPVSDFSNYHHQINGQTVAGLSILMYSFYGNYGKLVEPGVAASLKESPQTKSYKSAIAPLTTYVEDHLPNFNTLVYVLNIGPPQPLSTSHIKDKAWQFDVTLTKKSASLPYLKKIPLQSYNNWQGKLLYIWTNSHIYYILLDSVQQNWQPNLNTWQQVIDSIKVS